MSNLGVFHWIREGVKRSVLLGFSDAVEQLGVPADGHDLSPQLLSALRQSTAGAIEHEAATAAHHAPGKPERKRLGRSLEQMRETLPKPAHGATS